MNELPHFARFARALAVGAVAGSIAVAACNSGSTSTDTTNTGTTTTGASSGNEQPASADAGAPSQPTAGLSGSACTTAGEERANPEERGSLCTCAAPSGGGSPTWQCSPAPIAIEGPLPPPEMRA